MLEIKPLLPHEWPILKQMRLRALTDTPEAFSFTLARAQAQTDGDWQEWAGHFVGDLSAAMCIAYLDGMPCGMMGCYSAEPDTPGAGQAAELVAVWVDPAARGQGAAEALVASIVTWAVTQNIRTLQAWVMEDNLRAITFYKKVGFAETGQRLLEPTDPPKYALLLTRLV